MKNIAAHITLNSISVVCCKLSIFNNFFKKVKKKLLRGEIFTFVLQKPS